MHLNIHAGPDRLDFARSLFAEIDSIPAPGYLPAPRHRGGGQTQPPSYRGERFLTKDGDDKERVLLLVITSTKRCGGRQGDVQKFTALLWAECDEFRDLLSVGSLEPWIEFVGELDFTSQTGWVEMVKS